MATKHICTHTHAHTHTLTGGAVEELVEVDHEDAVGVEQSLSLKAAVRERVHLRGKARQGRAGQGCTQEVPQEPQCRQREGQPTYSLTKPEGGEGEVKGEGGESRVIERARKLEINNTTPNYCLSVPWKSSQPMHPTPTIVQIVTKSAKHSTKQKNIFRSHHRIESLPIT